LSDDWFVTSVTNPRECVQYTVYSRGNRHDARIFEECQGDVLKKEMEHMNEASITYATVAL
jgi:hypothetical protein